MTKTVYLQNINRLRYFYNLNNKELWYHRTKIIYEKTIKTARRQQKLKYVLLPSFINLGYFVPQI